MRRVGKDCSGWTANTVAMILSFLCFSAIRSQTLTFGGVRRHVLLKYYDVKDKESLSLVQKISKRVLSMP